MTDPVTAVGIGLGLAVAALVGSALHELTHAVVVVLLGHRLRGVKLARLLSTRRATVVYEPLYDRAWNHAIGLAPLLVGLAAAIGYLTLVGVPTGADGLVLAVGWAFYALQLSREDITGQRAPDDDREAKAMNGLFMAGVGFVVLLVDYPPGQFVGWILFLAGLGLATYNMAWVVKRKQHSDTVEAVVQSSE